MAVREPLVVCRAGLIDWRHAKRRRSPPGRRLRSPLGPHLAGPGPLLERRQLQEQLVAGHDLPAEASFVDPGKDGKPTGHVLAIHHEYRRRLRQRLDDENPGHHRITGEMTGQPGIFCRHVACTENPLVRNEFEDTIDEQEGSALRDRATDGRGIQQHPITTHCLSRSSLSFTRTVSSFSVRLNRSGSA